MHVLEVENLIRNYQKSALKKSDEDIKVLKGLNFSVEQGEFVGIMGKSGCGKTTLLKVLGMIDKQTDGVVRFMEKDTSKLYGDELADIRREQIGFVFQDFYLMDSLSVEENIMLPMILGQEKVDVMTKAARKYAEQFQINAGDGSGRLCDCIGGGRHVVFIGCQDDAQGNSVIELEPGKGEGAYGSVRSKGCRILLFQ